MSELLIIGVPFVASIPLWMSFGAYKRRYRKAHPGCWMIPPTKSALLANVLVTFSFMAFLWIVADVKPYL